MNWLKTLFAGQSAFSRQELIAQQQQLLASWRNMLQICLNLQLTLGEGTAPPDLAIGIVQARSEIGQIKDLLRGWGEDVIDRPEELSVADADTVTHHLKLLAIHRRNLANYLEQQRLYGERDTPPAILNGIATSRQEIQRIKSMLGTWNAPVTDQADDAA
jgi:hypothetical protein